MRITKLLHRVLRVTSLVVDAVRFETDGLIITVRPRWRHPRCGQCGRRAPGYDTKPEMRRWRSLSLGALRVFLEYAPRRVACPRCEGVRVERVPWAEHGSLFTEQFEELTAYLAQTTDKTSVTKLMGIAWSTVGNIITRVVERHRDRGALDGLRRIGIDEFSYRKRHRYATIVVDHDAQRVVWAGKGRGADTLGEFFKLLGKYRALQLEAATIDMAGGYVKALREHAPHVQVVFDRFHVQRLASDAVDEVRRELWRALRGTEDAHAVKRTRFVLLKPAA